jgi:hypothetical protein
MLKLTILIDTEADPSLVLELGQAFGETLADDLGTYGEDATVDENEISVEAVS